MRKIAAQYLFPGNSSPIKRGFVTLDDDGTILETGELDKESESTEFYNGIIIPGFVNSHCHIELSHLKGVFTQESGMAGFIKQIRVQRESAPKEERERAIEEQMDKMYKEGVSAMADISNSDESFVIKASSPLYTRTFLEVFGSEPHDMPKIMNQLKELKATADNIGIDSCPSPHACYTMSKDLLSESTAAGLDCGFISYHNQESWEEDQLIREGKGPLSEDYKSRGLSTPAINKSGPLQYFIDSIRLNKRYSKEIIPGNTLLVHNTFTDEQSINIALESLQNPYWAICPLSNIFIHRSLPPLELLRRKGAKITIGTDSLSSNTLLSMVAEMQSIQQYFPTVPLTEIVKWATLNGASFLGKERELGTIEVGKKPGIVLIENIDLQNLKLLPGSISRRLA
ncbi:MAG: amidohydrolase family protein [Bacteroidales bacterium]|nr:amidohydrolase family protein [Bacteroidales bacterium]